MPLRGSEEDENGSGERHTGTYWDILGHTGTYWDILGHTGNGAGVIEVVVRAAPQNPCMKLTWVRPAADECRPSPWGGEHAGEPCA
jgi:hypothetical protein